TRRTLLGMLAWLFGGFGAAKAAPVREVFWEKAGTGEWVRIEYTVTRYYHSPDGQLLCDLRINNIRPSQFEVSFAPMEINDEGH
ncbi:hypothetical protein LCGC14_1256310, partial [marine sediment metagenome]